MTQVGCVSTLLGIVSMILAGILVLLAVITRLTHWAPMHLGPRSFAAGAALLLLFSIALHTCQSAFSREAPRKEN
jgi:uncharacterized membrane protein required for colicin V production